MKWDRKKETEEGTEGGKGKESEKSMYIFFRRK
jgi:hypothetical protein